MNDSNKSDVGKVMSFSDHLSADEDVDIPCVHIPVHICEGVAASGGVSVKPGHPGTRKIFKDFFFQFLGTKTAEANHFSMALHATAGHSRREIAIVAEQAVFLAVKGEGDTAMGEF